MSIIKFNKEEYYNRFSPQKGWQKVLFRGDKKSQLAEFNELQSVINYQQQGAFSYLYFLHSITKGLKVNILDFGPDYIDIILSGGQVYMETDQGAFFIDISPKNLRLPSSGRHSIGILVDFLTQKNDNGLRDPISGGEVTGSLGTDRLLINYSIVLNTDSFPLSTLHCRGPYIIPDVYYYTDKRLTMSYGSSKLSRRIDKDIKQRWEEEIGNFIADGLEVVFEPNNLFLVIQPGVAYILGQRISLPYPKYIQLEVSTTGPVRYLVLLNNIGEINVTLVNALGPDLLHLASFELFTGVYERDYTIIPSKNRMPLVSDLLSLEEQNKQTEVDILQLALDTQALNTGADLELVGIFTDALVDLNRSDIYNPLYTATLLPAIRALRTNFIEKSKTLSNVNTINSVSISDVTKNGNPYYITTSYTESLFLEQPVSTNWLALGNTVKTVARMTLSPNRAFSVPNQTTSIIAASSLPTLQSSILKRLSVSSKTEFHVTTTIQSLTIFIDCDGFNANEDNLVLTFGNIRITQFTLTLGTNGSTFGTIKARSDGSVALSFGIPNNLPSGSYTVSLANNQVYAVSTFKGENIVSKRVELDLTEIKKPSLTRLTYGSLNEGICQTFFIDNPVILTSFAVKLRSAPSSLTLNFASASLVKAVAGFPTTDAFGKADMTVSNVNTDSNGTTWSTFTFDKPVYIPSRGEYGIVITPLVGGVEYYYAQLGRPNLTGGSSTVQTSINGNLATKTNGVWEVDLNKDLSLALYRAIPTNTSSEITLQILDTEEFNAVEFNIPYYNTSQTTVEFYNRESDTWRLIDKNNFQLQTPTTSTELKIKLTGNSTSFPLIESDNITFSTFRNSKSSTWIGRTVEYTDVYNTLEFSFEAYTPNGTSLLPRFSSNAGQSWEPMTLINTTLVNGNIPLYLLTYQAANLSTGINFNNQTILRKKLTLRIDFSTTTTSVVPFVRRLSSIVY